MAEVSEATVAFEAILLQVLISHFPGSVKPNRPAPDPAKSTFPTHRIPVSSPKMRKLDSFAALAPTQLGSYGAPTFPRMGPILRILKASLAELALFGA